MKISGRFVRGLALLLGVLLAGPVLAQATRTWISGVGDDANPCSRTAPCKTFAGAISKTAIGGVIDILDPGGFGALTITKSITLENVGAVGGVLVSGTNGMVVSAPASSVVVMRGLSFEGLGTGVSGVQFNTGSELILERCDINNFTNAGINFAPNQATAASLTVRDSTIHNNGNSANTTTTGGIQVSTIGGAVANVTLENVRVVNNKGFGLQVQGSANVTLHDSLMAANGGNGVVALASANVTVHDSVVTVNGGNGVLASSTGAAANLLLDHAIVSGNAAGGVVGQGSAALVQLTDSTITGNAQGISATQSAEIMSFGNNRNFGNTLNGAPTSTNSLQ